MKKASPSSQVSDFYEESADSYAAMMDSEIDLPMYDDVLGRLATRLVDFPGTLIDTSCGSGHMLQKYHDKFDTERPLVGIDLSPRMCEIAQRRLGSSATILTGDMRDLAAIESGQAAALLAFFSVHHLDPADIGKALLEWKRVLAVGGQLLIAAWEGSGAIDFGEVSDVVAFRYSKRQVVDWAQAGGFDVNRCVVEPVDEIPMDAVYLEATKLKT